MSQCGSLFRGDRGCTAGLTPIDRDRPECRQNRPPGARVDQSVQAGAWCEAGHLSGEVMPSNECRLYSCLCQLYDLLVKGGSLVAKDMRGHHFEHSLAEKERRDIAVSPS